MEAPEDFQEGRALPNKYRRGLDALVVNYPGCIRDLAIARNAIEKGSKKEFLKLFRKLKLKQVAHEHCLETNDSSMWNSDELEYPGNESDKRKLQAFFRENHPNAQNIKIFREQIEGLHNKNAVVHGDRSHPNIIALLKLKLNYPGCEKDVQDALQVHYSRPTTKFPNKIHSLKTKQSLYMGDRSHWRLVQLDDLELTYPRWRRDIEAAEDWHIHNAEDRENNILFHEIIEGMLEKQSLYLEWVLRRRQPDIDAAKKYKKRDKIDDVLEAIDIYENLVNTSFDKFYIDRREDEEKKFPAKQSSWSDEEREPVVEYGRP
eukprot:CAMPEP_0116143240 /NCGR_PEP_ID=MMETSP0329-20121206/15343_1 /TAXON_ID=697910 /ORGANISM="Pseudo-nitzschia arenysensis, Strain B593" /LENGTH=317 /DNA_ID=CAMNT_0003638543 /DNA_START=8 /DNA_END=961 /DNA_ORIENTATION=+